MDGWVESRPESQSRLRPKKPILVPNSNADCLTFENTPGSECFQPCPQRRSRTCRGALELVARTNAQAHNPFRREVTYASICIRRSANLGGRDYRAHFRTR